MLNLIRLSLLICTFSFFLSSILALGLLEKNNEIGYISNVDKEFLKSFLKEEEAEDDESGKQVTPKSPKPKQVTPKPKQVTPKPDNPEEMSESVENLEKQTKPKCKCGARNELPRIVGGEDADAHEFGWRCSFQRADRSLCGCSIISEQHILIAAHCTNDAMTLLLPFTSTVTVGGHELRGNNVGEKVRPRRIYQHPQYNPVTQNNDIAIIRLRRRLKFGRNISPLCLPWNYENKTFENKTVVASGWGTEEEGGTAQNILQKVDLPIMTTIKCREKYPNSITDNMICTYLPGKDTCQGDSGGSIDWMDEYGRYIGIGVVSWGQGCAREEKPGVYTKIDRYLPWIRSIARDVCTD